MRTPATGPITSRSTGRFIRIASGLALTVVVLAGCSNTQLTQQSDQGGQGAASTQATDTASGAPPAPAASAASSATSSTGSSAGSGADAAAPADGVEGTVVRFSAGGTAVDVTIGEDTPTTRDFVSLLPFTMQLEEFAGREKIGDPPRGLDVEGTPGSDPEDGDLIYFTPWGNLGFYYDTSGIGYSDSTPHLGTYQASEEQLSQLEGQQVTVEVVS